MVVKSFGSRVNIELDSNPSSHSCHLCNLGAKHLISLGHSPFNYKMEMIMIKPTLESYES